MPHVFAILTDRGRPGRITIGTEDGVWRSDDAGDSWRRLSAPKPEFAVWSLADHPREPDTIFAGYEPCAIYRSTDDGSTWQRLPVKVTFPAISDHPDIPKRVISIAVDPANPDEIYASIEVGGLLRSLDNGQSWSNLIEGLYIDEGSVDIHSVVVSPKLPGQLTDCHALWHLSQSRSGLALERSEGSASSPDRLLLPEAGLRSRRPRHTLSRQPGTISMETRAHCSSVATMAPLGNRRMSGIPLKTTIFGLAVNPNRPDHVFCSSKIGQVLHSSDRGRNWRVNPLPHAAGHVFALSVAEIANG